MRCGGARRAKVHRRLALPFLLAGTACSGFTFQPRGVERPERQDRYLDMYSADFEVACDSCSVQYGPATGLQTAVSTGSWTGAVYLGTLPDGETVRVLLRARRPWATRASEARRS